MRKTLVIAAILLIGALAGVVIFRSYLETRAAVQSGESSEQKAEELQVKIDAIKKAEESETDHGPAPAPVEVEVTDVELESYVLHSMREEIPAQIDSFDVQLTPGSVAADTQMTFTSMNSGNPIVDMLASGTHNMFVKGKLSGSEGRGKFELEEIRIDGIPVPNILIEALFDKYVKPKYPEADLKEPFDLPWGIDQITIEEGKARIRY